ncbi:hypothetical protein DXG03_001720 [Asterophora parasitica]|uniref:Fido domain-containing protein n=1 Tax=Asterophora parasitica TaxID=117018 RepID=A0A9P7KGM7_9AGAR|nr:hypothetical protein DXG03_001720 [Asterophora parasitica]
MDGYQENITWTLGGSRYRDTPPQPTSNKEGLFFRQLDAQSEKEVENRYILLSRLVDGHPTDPYLLASLARLKYILEALHLASEHWTEAQHRMGGTGVDELFDHSLETFRAWHKKIVDEDDQEWSDPSSGKIVVAWRSLHQLSEQDGYDSPPSYSLVIQRWEALKESVGGPELFKRYLRLLHFDSLELESVFRLDLLQAVKLDLDSSELPFGMGLSTDLSSHLHLLSRLPISSLNDNNTPITSQWIDELHGTIMQASQINTTMVYDIPYKYLVPAGRKREQMSFTTMMDAPVDIVQYAPWWELETEMEKYCKEIQYLLDEMKASRVQPTVVAAWAHSAFVLIHPYGDGNGCLSRLLASIPLLRAGDNY